jgi:hypothetical protein
MKQVNIESQEFISFVEGIKAKMKNYYSDYNITDPVISFKKGKKYIKIIRDNSVYAFIEISTGNVLKPASWAAPAKHSRGNIFEEDNGLSCCGMHSVAYLR